jgi:hypothetical protein
LNAKANWRNLLASLRCVVGSRHGGCEGQTELHHVAEGSGPRHDYGLVPLCTAHHDPHRTGSGFHGMGTERFCKLFRVPGENEYGLLIWTMEDVAVAIRRAA